MHQSVEAGSLGTIAFSWWKEKYDKRATLTVGHPFPLVLETSEPRRKPPPSHHTHLGGEGRGDPSTDTCTQDSPLVET